jgi:hypothetical protein
MFDCTCTVVAVTVAFELVLLLLSSCYLGFHLYILYFHAKEKLGARNLRFANGDYTYFVCPSLCNSLFLLYKVAAMMLHRVNYIIIVHCKWYSMSTAYV